MIQRQGDFRRLPRSLRAKLNSASSFCEAGLRFMSQNSDTFQSLGAGAQLRLRSSVEEIKLWKADFGMPSSRP